MKLTPDDPRLTAYVLGELSPAERAAVEAELEKSFACQQAVEEIRQTAKLLKENFAAEESPGLTFAQQRQIEDQLRRREKPTTNWFRFLWYGGLSATAVCVIAIAMFSDKKSEPMHVALDDPAKTKIPETPALAVQEQKHASEKLPQDLALKGQAEDSKTPLPVLDLYHNVPVPSPAMMPMTPAEMPPAPSPAPVLSVPAPGGRPAAIRAGGGGGANAGGGPYRFAAELDGSVANNTVPVYGDIPTEGRLFGKNRYYVPGETATYPHLVDNPFLTALEHPLSTFSIDVDTASYSNMRRFLNEGRMPPHDAVRIEELVNYFRYDYPQPRSEDPFSADIEVAGCPWNSDHRLVRIGLKGREIAQDKRPPSNFVFLIDVSGSMQPRERLPLIKQALRQLVKKMTENDRVAIVVYASEAGIRLPSTSCVQKEKILEAIDELGAGGSTAGAAGIQAAYEVAQENFIKGGVNRVLLCTDGDFNVGMTDQGELVRLIEDKAKGGVFLTTLGVGTDNYKDALMQKLADKGNGNYYYLDTLEEAQKVLIEQMNGTLVTIAKDVKIQVEFNPSQVAAYRLIGYEKRLLKKEDFNNDKKDAGEIGAGHTVTALYEVVPPGQGVPAPKVDDLKYQQPVNEKPARYVVTGSKELLTLKLRYKQPDGDTSKLLVFPVTDGGKSWERASGDFRFAAAVAEFGMLLRDSEYTGNASYGKVLEMAQGAKGTDAEGYRSEFLTLVRKARELAH